MDDGGAAAIATYQASEIGMDDRLESEALLLARARQGDAAAFERLVNDHMARVVNLAWRMLGQRQEAEDIAQEAFLRLYRALPGLRGDCRVMTWLYKVVSRLVIDHFRREKVRRRLFFFRRGDEDADPVVRYADPAASPRDQLLGREARDCLLRAMKQLSARQRAVFVLRHQEGLSLKEIAALLGIREGTVKVHLHRAVRYLRGVFEEREGEES
jgi:RNA polymerase sigma-70 factor (ECF subfamily)